MFDTNAPDATNVAITERYTYIPLARTDSIRLLQLHPHGNANTSLSGSLTEVCLDDKPEFEALSYAWGEDESQPHSLTLDSLPFPISETLSTALHVLRHPGKPRNLWIDAICIYFD
jgi:hypothetical protein